eukprot:s1434_g7.t1
MSLATRLRECFRPTCSPAVRHQVRLEVVLGCVPLACFLCLIFGAGRASLGLRAIFLANAIAAVLVMIVGFWLLRTNSLLAMAHFLEDTSRSNSMLTVFSWVPVLAVSSPILLLGTSQDVLNTLLTQALGFYTMYVPLLDEPRELLLLWTCYCALAVARLFHLSVRADTVMQIEGFSLGGAAAAIACATYVRLRLHHLMQSILNPDPKPRRRKSRLQFEDYLCMADPIHGDAHRMATMIFQRRQQLKQELLGRVVWAAHFSVQRRLDSSSIAHILSFLDTSGLGTSMQLGLLDDRASQVSTIDMVSSVAPSSLSSVSAEPQSQRRESEDDEPASQVPWLAFFVLWSAIGEGLVTTAEIPGTKKTSGHKSARDERRGSNDSEEGKKSQGQKAQKDLFGVDKADSKPRVDKMKVVPNHCGTVLELSPQYPGMYEVQLDGSRQSVFFDPEPGNYELAGVFRYAETQSFASKPRSAMARTATTAMAARWDAGGQITMGAAGRDRRVRAEPKIRTKKSRQPGAREEESHDEKEVVKKRPASALQEHFENRALVSSSSVPARPYTDPRQESPDRKRGWAIGSMRMVRKDKLEN